MLSSSIDLQPGVHPAPRQGVLILAPPERDGRWSVLGMSADLEDESFTAVDPYESLQVEPFDCANANEALAAAREILTYVTERRTPGLQAHFVPYLRTYVDEAERRGHDRGQVVAQLLTLLDNHERRRSGAAESS